VVTRAPDDAPSRPLRVAFVPGVMPDKWARRWAERMPRVPLQLLPVEDGDQTAVLYDGRADMALVRLPVDTESLHVIPLYREVPVVVVPKGHFVEAADEVTVADLADEHVHAAPPLSVKDAVEAVAAGTGIVVVPLSVARLHQRKDVAVRPVVDLPEHPVGLAWLRDVDDDRFEAFIGIVRGRTPNSSRGPSGTPDSPGKPAAPRPRGATRSAKPARQARRPSRGRRR
jgi:DNA-binding transcriptional LysR family regulator